MANASHVDHRAVARRLRLLQAKIGGKYQNAFAANMGFSTSRWANFVGGTGLPRDSALQLVQRIPGLTFDWLYLGRVDGLPVALARELGEIEPATTEKTSA